MKSLTITWKQIAGSRILNTSDSAITYRVEGIGDVWVTTDYARQASLNPDSHCVLISISGEDNRNVIWLFSRLESPSNQE